MGDSMFVRQGDLEPPIQITCEDKGVPIDLTTATSVQIRGRIKGSSTYQIDRVADSAGSDGVAQVALIPSDTATVGTIEVVAVVTWAGSRPQTFPPTGALLFNVEPKV